MKTLDYLLGTFAIVIVVLQAVLVTLKLTSVICWTWTMTLWPLWLVLLVLFMTYITVHLVYLSTKERNEN